MLTVFVPCTNIVFSGARHGGSWRDLKDIKVAKFGLCLSISVDLNNDSISHVGKRVSLIIGVEADSDVDVFWSDAWKSGAEGFDKAIEEVFLSWFPSNVAIYKVDHRFSGVFTNLFPLAIPWMPVFSGGHKCARWNS